MPKVAKTFEESVAHFWAGVKKQDGTQCWLWTRSLNKDGYGKFWHDGREWKASRFAWFATYGSIEKFVLHKCDVRHCCRPDHLFIGTAKENTWDMIKKGRSGNKACHRFVDEALAEELLAESLVRGTTVTEIAERHGLSVCSAAYNIRQMREKKGFPKLIGGRLTENQRFEIADRAKVEQKIILAREFGIHECTVYEIIKWAAKRTGDACAA